MKATKHDKDKPRTDLIPASTIIALGKVYSHGAAKYAPWNWKGLKITRLYGATLRHLAYWFSGEDLDPDSGLPHLQHALTNLSMMVDVEASGYLHDGENLDDRQTSIGERE